MHKCLQITEILSIIIDYLSANDRKDRATLSALARTCGTFQGIALNVLWRHQDGLLNVLKCLPGDAWEIGIPREDWLLEASGPLVITRPLGPGDWRRFDFYARRVRSFGKRIDDSNPPNIEGDLPSPVTLSASVFTELSLRRADSPLFPDLRRLLWKAHWTDKIDLHYVPLLLGPKMERLSFHMSDRGWGDPDRDMLPILCKIATSCPQIQELGVLGSFTILPTITRILPRLRFLRKLSVICDSAGDLISLSRTLRGNPSLCTLRLRINRPPGGAAVTSGSIPLAETSTMVHALEIESATMIDFCNALQIFRPDQARRVRILLQRDLCALYDTEYELSLSGKLIATLNTLSKVFSPSVLESISITLQDIDHCCHLRDLRPLLSFNKLVELHIKLNANLVVDDAVVEQMALSWPRLRVLDLNGGRWVGPGHPPLTFAAMAYLARHCPDLLEISLAVDGCNLAKYEAVAASQNRHNKLIRMRLGNSTLSSRDRFIRLLLDWFPCLEEVRGSADAHNFPHLPPPTTSSPAQHQNVLLQLSTHLWLFPGTPSIKGAHPQGVETPWLRADAQRLDSDESDSFPESPCLLAARSGDSEDDSDVPQVWLDGQSRLAAIKRQRRDVEAVGHKLARLGIQQGVASDAESSASSEGTLVDTLIPSLSAVRIRAPIPTAGHLRPARPHTPSLASDSEWHDTDGSYSGYESSRRRATARQLLQKAAGLRHAPVAGRASHGADARRAAAPYPYPAPPASLRGAFAYPSATRGAFACGAWNGDLLAASWPDADHDVEATAAHMSRLDLGRPAMRLDHQNGAWFPFTFNCAVPY
ncbi:hypothetical protein CERSUDRAFT_93039 [Gelatoporia subvermispora B]|uniref:F-box domain-containing protein n=1 Tax=Ceriporiopsis subvermispora (strain B) TaxID=914234 RepID=M2PQZ2_CERS8|nr:hypothetical protein CERSUDRAFT_93039 [Gelatoporia subvermispora B]